METLELVKKIKDLLEDKKGEDIICLDIGEKSTITDYMIIATGNVDTHVRALAEYVVVELKKLDISPVYHEGIKYGTWICVDYGNIILHIMRKNEREFYNLEAIWGSCPKI